jgi:hypothetical protein
MSKAIASKAIVEAPAKVELPVDINLQINPAIEYSPLMVVSNRVWPADKWVWYGLAEAPDTSVESGSTTQTIKAALRRAEHEKTQIVRYNVFVARTLRDLDKLVVNPLISVLQSALEVAEADLVTCQVLLQSKLADLSFVRQELAKLTGKAIPKSKSVVLPGTPSNRSRSNADRFGLVGNESAWMEAVAMGPCTMTVALERCGQRWPQTALAKRMIVAGYLSKSDNTYSVRS